MAAHPTAPRTGSVRPLVATVGLGGGGIFLALGAAAVAAYAIPSLQLVNRYAVMAAALIPYGLFAFAGAAVILATSSRRWVKPVAVLAVAGMVLQGWWARPYWPEPAPVPSGQSLTLLTMNMRCDSRGIRDLAALTERVQPDVVVVQGFYWAKRESLGDAWDRLLPHAAFHPMPRLPTCGTFVFSRTPLQQLSRAADAQPVVQVDRPDGAIVLLPVDLPTPGKGVAPWLDAFTHLSEGSPLTTTSPSWRGVRGFWREHRADPRAGASGAGGET